MSEAESGNETEHWITNETTSDWLETPHECVHIRDEWVIASPFSPTGDLVKAGAVVAEALPGDWTVILTGGTYRGHDLRHLADLEAKRINLDFYYQRPGFDHLTDVIEDVKRALDDASSGQTEVSD